MTAITRWTAGQAGCIYGGGATRTGDDLCAAVILLAATEGWDDPDEFGKDAQTLYAQDAPHGVYWADDPELSEALNDGARQAEDWLNEHIAPEGYGFLFEDGFYLWPLDEQED